VNIIPNCCKTATKCARLKSLMSPITETKNRFCRGARMGAEPNQHPRPHLPRGTAQALSGAVEEGAGAGIFLAKLHRALTACGSLRGVRQPCCRKHAQAWLAHSTYYHCSTSSGFPGSIGMIISEIGECRYTSISPYPGFSMKGLGIPSFPSPFSIAPIAG
jgi:hypothetical protein